MSRAGKMIVKERSKDFKGSITRLIGNLRPWKLIMIMALTLAMISAILSLIAPDKLSALADEITKGIKPNQENLELIGIKIGENFTEENLNSKIPSLFTELELTEDELIKVNEVFSKIENNNEENLFLQLPDKVLLYLLEDFNDLK